MKIISETLETKVRYSCDVLVAGGGIAGIAAAMAAAREGAEVILLERSYTLGGLATSGLVTIYLPLCDGMGHQVSFGIAEELLKLSIEHGDEGRYPKAWLDGGTSEEKAEKRYEVQFNPHLFAISAERELSNLGVKILYGVTAVATSENEGKIKAVVVEGKSGREAIEVKRSVVDATGDADICHLSGAACRDYSYGNTLAAWYYYDSGEGNKLKMHGFADVVGNEPTREISRRRYTGLDTEEISEMMIDSHRAIEKDVLDRRAAGETKLFPTCIASIPQLRMTRGIVGVTDASLDDDHKHIEDSVGIYSNWRKRGPAYELSFRTLYGKNIKNLLAAGRCISSETFMWDITRVIPVCAVSGEAAGVAAAMTDNVHTLNVSALQSKLREKGVKIHLSEL